MSRNARLTALPLPGLRSLITPPLLPIRNNVSNAFVQYHRWTASTYLGPYIARQLGHEAPGEFSDHPPPPEDQAAPRAALELLLAAADSDAGVGDFEGALKWLRLVEQVDLVIPSEYVVRRDEWQRRLDPARRPAGAAARIDPTLDSGAAAVRDLERRDCLAPRGERRHVGEMREHLWEADEGLVELSRLTRQAKMVKGVGTRRSTR